LLQGICQLFEVYFYFVFKTFVQRDGSSGSRGSVESLNRKQDLSHQTLVVIPKYVINHPYFLMFLLEVVMNCFFIFMLAARLRSTLVRITQDLQEQRPKLQAASVAPASTNSSFFQVEVSPVNPMHTSSVPGPTKFYGLKVITFLISDNSYIFL
jgi:hypothetical protein